MAIDSKYLEDSPADSGAVERLRRKRIRPWESHLVPGADPPSAKADTEPTQSQHNGSESAAPKADTEPTQTRHDGEPVGETCTANAEAQDLTKPTQSRHEAHHVIENSAATQSARYSPKRADTEPTQNGPKRLEDKPLTSTASGGSPAARREDSEPVSGVKAPATEAKEPTQSRHNSDLVSAAGSLGVGKGSASRADTEATQSRHNVSFSSATSADTEPTQSRHEKPSRADTTRAQEVEEPTQSRHSNQSKASRADTEPTPEPTQSRHRADTRTDTNFGESFENPFDVTLRGLRGAKLELMEFLCAYGTTQRSRIISGLTYEYMAKRSGVSLGSVRTTAKRLRDQALIEIRPLGLGPGAMIEIELPESVFIRMAGAIFPAKADTEPTQSRHQNRHKADTRTDTTAPSSSGSNSYLNRTTTTGVGTPVAPEWLSIDIAPVSSVGFSQTHLKQLCRAGLLSPVEVQDSIDAFAFDLEVNGKGKKLTGPPLNFFMGCLRRGQYAPPENYESPKAKGARLRAEALDRELEALRLLAEKERVVAFEKWRIALTPEQVRQFAPKGVGAQSTRAELINYFEANVYVADRSVGAVSDEVSR